MFFCFLCTRQTNSLWPEISSSKVIFSCEGDLFSLRTNGFTKEFNSKPKQTGGKKHLSRNTKRSAEAVLNPSNHSTWIRALSEKAESGLFIDENETAERGVFFEMHYIK